MCADGSRARMARYWEDECKDLHDITDIKDKNFASVTCQFLNDTMRQVGSIAFYCDGPDGVGAASEMSLRTLRGRKQNYSNQRRSCNLHCSLRNHWCLSGKAS